MTDKHVPKDADAIVDNELYFVRIEFRSVGDNNQVIPEITYSHKFSDEYKGEFPASYLLARDMLMMLNVMSSMHAQAQEFEDDGFLSPDELIEAAAAAEQSGDDTPPTIN